MKIILGGILLVIMAVFAAAGFLASVAWIGLYSGWCHAEKFCDRLFDDIAKLGGK